MKLFIVATPLFDASMAVQAYRLRDRSANRTLDAKQGHSRMTEALLSPGLDLIEKIGIEPFAPGKPLFADINQYQLLTGKPANMRLDPASLVCVLPGGVAAEDALLEKCAALQGGGYTIALDGFPLNGIDSPFFSYASYLILHSRDPRFPDVYRAVRARLEGVRVVIDDVPDTETFYKLALNRNALFSGSFYNQPITKGISKISPVKVNALQLMSRINAPDFDLQDIARIVQRDPALSISLLRFINSAASGPGRKIQSIPQAVAILGQQETRRWATVAIQVGLAENRPGEITRLSLIRARFAENLAGAFALGVFQPALFMAGLFSLLDVILQQPMERAIHEVAVDDRVRRCLVEQAGEFNPVMRLIFAYERADWDLVSRIMIQNGVDVEAVHQAFVEALTWYHQLLSSVDADRPE